MRKEALLLEIRGNDRIPICIVSFTGFDFSLSNENVFITDAKNSIYFKEIIKVENNGTKRNLLYSLCPTLSLTWVKHLLYNQLAACFYEFSQAIHILQDSRDQSGLSSL